MNTLTASSPDRQVHDFFPVDFEPGGFEARTPILNKNK